MSPVAVSFLCHCPSAFAAWGLPSVLPFGVRTFLGLAHASPRSPGLHGHCTEGTVNGLAAEAASESSALPHSGQKIEPSGMGLSSLLIL